MSAAQVHWLLARALAPRNFITIPVNWDFPQAHLSCCLVYKYDAPQVKLCHFDSDTPIDTSLGSSEFPRRRHLVSPQTMSNDSSVCDIRRLPSKLNDAPSSFPPD